MGKKTFKEPDNWDQLSDDAKESLRLSHNWVNMLTVVPGISEAKARRIASVYPSAHTLMDQYLDVSVSERVRQLLLQDLFRENNSGGGGGGAAGGKGKTAAGGKVSAKTGTSTSSSTSSSSSAKGKSTNKPLVATKTMRQVTPLALITTIYTLTNSCDRKRYASQQVTPSL